MPDGVGKESQDESLEFEQSPPQKTPAKPEVEPRSLRERPPAPALPIRAARKKAIVKVPVDREVKMVWKNLSQYRTEKSVENNAITEFFRRVLSPAVGAHFDTSRSGKRHLKKIHRLQGTDPIVKVFFVKRVEFCRFCPAELTGSNRTRH